MAILFAVNFKRGEGWLLEIFRCDVFPPIEIDISYIFRSDIFPNRNWYIVFHLRLQWLCIRRFVGNCPRIIKMVMMTTMRWQNTVNYDNDDDNDNVNHDNDDDVHIMMKFIRVCVSRWMCWQIIFFVFVLQTKNL